MNLKPSARAASNNPFEGDDDSGQEILPVASAVGHDEQIFFVAILRNDETLVKHSHYAGNYDDVLRQILPRIVKTNGTKMTFTYDEFSFHYIYDNTIVYFCITKLISNKQPIFQFLERVKSKFESQYEKRMLTALSFAFQAEFLSTLQSETRRHNEHAAFDKIAKVQSSIDETRQILTEDIDRLTDRGEKLHLLVDKTEHLNESSISFRMSSRSLARSFYMQNVRLVIGIVLIALITIYVIVSLSCGGLTWSTCVR